jgi:hypothetical protein
MAQSLFRKTPLERVMGAENLNEYIRATKPGAWFALAGLFLILSGIFVWVFSGTISDTVHADCFVRLSAEEVTVRTHLPLGQIKKLETGMEVQISPDYAPREEYGYVFGKISNIIGERTDEEQLTVFWGTYGDIEEKQKGPYYEVVITVEKTGDTVKWSNPKGSAITLEDGAYCNSLIVLRTRHPYQFFWN